MKIKLKWHKPNFPILKIFSAIKIKAKENEKGKKQKRFNILNIISDKWMYSIVFSILFFYAYWQLSQPFLQSETMPVNFMDKIQFDPMELMGPVVWERFRKIYSIVGYVGLFLVGFIQYRSLFENFLMHKRKSSTEVQLEDSDVKAPPYPWDYTKLQFVIGLKHNKFDLILIKYPTWIIIPDVAMFQNLVITGAIGTGKTSTVMYPLCKQALFYKANMPEEKAGALILDVKGNFYEKVLEFARECGREEDIILIKLGGDIKYNPLHKPHMEPIDLAERSRTVIDLFSGGAKKEAFWDIKAGQMMAETIRLMRMVNEGYLTLSDVHKIVTNSEYLNSQLAYLDSLYSEGKLNEFDYLACTNYFYGEFSDSKAEKTIDTIKACVTEMTAFFASSERIHDSFCPPLKKPDSDKSTNFYGFRDVIDNGKIVVLAMNVQEYPKVSKTIAAYLKLDFQAEIVQRTVKDNPINKTRPMFFISDEYQEFVTANDGDFYGLSRESRCCSVVSSQSYSSISKTLGNDKSFNTLQQNLINKIWLRTDDKLTIDTAQLLTGKEEKEKISKNISESAGDAKRSKLFGKLVSGKQSVSESTTISKQKDFVFEERVFTQVVKMGKAVAYVADEEGMQEPTIVHLLPYYKPPITQMKIKPAKAKKAADEAVFLKL